MLKEISKKSRLLIMFVFVLVVILIIAWYPHYFEAKYQETYKKNTNHDNSLLSEDCRFKNSAYSYDNDLNFEIHRFVFLDKASSGNFNKGIKTVFHLYAIDKENKIYDVSNGKNELGISYEDFIEKNNIIMDEVLLSGKMSDREFNLSVKNYRDIVLMSFLTALPIYYITYKLNR